MADYKAMYYYLAGRMSVTAEFLDATTGALVQISEKMKESQQLTEELFMNSEEVVLDLIDKQTTPKE